MIPSRARPALLLAPLALTAACASLEPEPCTAEWIDWHKQRLFAEFRQDYRSEIATLRDLGEGLRDPGPLTMMRLATSADDIAAMATDFTNNTVPEIQATLAPCQSPSGASALLADMLRQEGVNEDALRWIETLGPLIEDTAA